MVCGGDTETYCDQVIATSGEDVFLDKANNLAKATGAPEQVEQLVR